MLDYRDPEWVATTLGLEKNTVYKYLQDGTLPGLQLGRKWLVSERRLASFLESVDRRQTEQRQRHASSWTRAFRRFDAFDEHAQTALNSARDVALELWHNHIGTEHLLLGVAAQTDSLAARTLVERELDAPAVRREIERRIGRGRQPVDGEPIKLTPRAKSALGRACDEARNDEMPVTPEHLLLGLMLMGDGVAYRILRERGLNIDAMRTRFRRRTTGR